MIFFLLSHSALKLSEEIQSQNGDNKMNSSRPTSPENKNNSNNSQQEPNVNIHPLPKAGGSGGGASAGGSGLGGRVTRLVIFVTRYERNIEESGGKITKSGLVSLLEGFMEGIFGCFKPFMVKAAKAPQELQNKTEGKLFSIQN